MHNYLLRHYLAEHGIDPDRDVQIRSVPPPEMVANLRADNIDGYLGPDPFNQRAVFDGVGFIHILTEGIVGRASVLRLRRAARHDHRHAQYLRRADALDHRGHRLFQQGREPARGGAGDRRAELPEPAAHGGASRC